MKGYYYKGFFIWRDKLPNCPDYPWRIKSMYFKSKKEAEKNIDKYYQDIEDKIKGG